VIAVRTAAERYVVEHDGIRSRHCFAAGGHYDPANLSYGPVLAVDEHLLAPGAGFPEHAHRGVLIASWVLEGVLRHHSGGTHRLVRPGELFVQDASDGIRHVERNASDAEPLRFVQTTWLAGSGARLDVVRGDAQFRAPVHLYVASGAFTAGGRALAAGDSLRADEPVAVTGDGEALAVRWGSAG
jgi:redox-sensitive bicupin YhaK (pirin superfamily)